LVRFVIPTLALSLVPIATAVAASSSTTPAQASTPSYVYKVYVGSPEQMWTPAQVKAKHPTTGEVMLVGSMGGAMSMGGSQRHLEVHILSHATGKPVAGVHPTISILDTTAKNAMLIKVPVAEMEGVTAGGSDLHYGNNVDMVGGHLYRVTVTLNGQRGTVTVVAPR
jgi:hypothetical protein